MYCMLLWYIMIVLRFAPRSHAFQTPREKEIVKGYAQQSKRNPSHRNPKGWIRPDQERPAAHEHWPTRQRQTIEKDAETSLDRLDPSGILEISGVAKRWNTCFWLFFLMFFYPRAAQECSHLRVLTLYTIKRHQELPMFDFVSWAWAKQSQHCTQHIAQCLHNIWMLAFFLSNILFSHAIYNTSQLPEWITPRSLHLPPRPWKVEW